MSIDNDKLDRFTKAVDEEVDVKIDKILSEAIESKDEILVKANDSCLNLAYDKIKTGMKHIASKYVRLVAAKELESRREVLVHREELAAKVFDEVRKKLSDFSKLDEYKNYLAVQINSALNDSKGKAVVFLSEKDIALSTGLEKELSSKAEFLIDKGIKLGGARILFPDENIAIDKTFDAAVEEQRDLFSHDSGLRLS
jgi:vacuolar-type H+-ATPase subunit E/Vma4